MKKDGKILCIVIGQIVLTASLAIALGSQFPRLLAHIRGNVTTGDFASHVNDQPQRLTLYGTKTCPHCISARQFLVRANIPFNDRILEDSPDAEKKFQSLNQDGVPVLVSRSGLVSGFNAAAFVELAKSSSQQ